MADDPMVRPIPPALGRVFNEVPEIYDRVRPGYPDELFADLAAVTGMDERSSVLEVGCGTGQATRSLAALGCPVTAVEPGADTAAPAHRRIAAFRNAAPAPDSGRQPGPSPAHRPTPACGAVVQARLRPRR
ncbi:methyltransferase domain-containing protein [Streptomyces sp. NPDC006465]|uniref:methyltransferase domain-containing protein n=1 Tax=Streptomyces sp. NPDC006465 TaxID=3157174 RepID=UPI00339DC45E